MYNTVKPVLVATSINIGVGRFRILGGPRFRILGGPRGGAEFPAGTCRRNDVDATSCAH